MRNREHDPALDSLHDLFYNQDRANGHEPTRRASMFPPLNGRGREWSGNPVALRVTDRLQE